MNRAALRGLTRTYLTVDGRSLAACRVALGTVLLVDLLRRVPWIRDFYSNAGLLPNHSILWRPPQARLFSVFFMASRPDESAALFVVAFFCFFFLLVGFRTRVFHVLSFAMTTSLHNRILPAENAASVALGVLMVWTFFLPLGRRFSVDAWLTSWRAGRDESPDDIEAGRIPEPDARPAVSLAVLALLLQLAAIYLLNFAHKSGVTWKDGSAVHYVLYQERIVTWLGVWVRQHASFALTRAVTYGTLVIEASAPLLLLTPIFWRKSRLLAVVLLTGMHGGIALLVNLGTFSAAMIAYFPLLIDSTAWDWLARRWRASGVKTVAFYDAGCGICFGIVRVLARLDVWRRVTWVPNVNPGVLPAGVDTALLERTVVVHEPGSGRWWTRSDAIARLLRALPTGPLWAWSIRVPGVRGAAGRAYDAFARNRASISAWFGLRACSIGQPHVASAGPEDGPLAATASPSRVWWRRITVSLREIGVVFALVLLGADLLDSNAAVPPALRWDHRPPWMAESVMAVRIFEGWGLFSPDAPLKDYMVVVDAVTKDGRHVDPYNAVGSRVSALPVADIPVRLGNDSLFCDYTSRIPGLNAYHQALQEWILRYGERTGDPRDVITSFEAYILEHSSPAPGQAAPTNVRRTTFLRWKQPAPSD